MGLLANLFNLILYQPLFNILILLYEYLPGHDFGVAVIVLTALTKLLTYPLGVEAIKTQKTFSDLQGKIQEIQERYKNDKAKQAEATMELYKKEKINPFSGILLLLLQLPILIALYRVFWTGLAPESMNFLYSFVPHPGLINTSFLGILDLAKPSAPIAVLAGIAQFLQSKTAIPKPEQKQADGKNKGIAKPQGEISSIMQKEMQYFFPVFTVLILLKIPSAVGLYWVITTLFSIIQQYFIYQPKLSSC